MNRRGKQARLLTGGIVGALPVTAPGDEHWDDVSLLIRGDTLTDLSGNAHTLTAYGNGTWQNNAVAADIADGTDQKYISTGMTGPFVFSCGDGTVGGPPSVTTDITANFGQNDTFNGAESAGAYTDANGLGRFQYKPPAGFVGLYTTTGSNGGMFTLYDRYVDRISAST